MIKFHKMNACVDSGYYYIHTPKKYDLEHAEGIKIIKINVCYSTQPDATPRNRSDKANDGTASFFLLTPPS
ncbi:hypothetical protein DSUL_30138 [Desulfovibrionales bacterium]